MAAGTLVIGLGNGLRRDDGVALQVIREVRGRAPISVRAEELSSDTLALLDLWAGADDVIVVDAVQSGRSPGTIIRLDLAASGCDDGLRSWTRSSHSVGLVETVALARALNRLPRRLLVYGIEAEDVGYGRALSGPVARAAHELADRLVSELWARPAAKVY
jgi:hydrogenase maturation protease